MEVHALAQGKKNARRRKAWIIFQDESGLSQKPPVHSTWAPKGQTPVLLATASYKRLSVSAAIAYQRQGPTLHTRVLFDIIKDSYTSAALIAFLRALHRRLRGDRVTLVWDNLKAHVSEEMRTYLHEQRHWLTIERLPPYAPQLNPVEQLWSNLKRREMANFCAENLDALRTQACAGLKRLRSTHQLALSFLKHTGLSL